MAATHRGGRSTAVRGPKGGGGTPTGGRWPMAVGHGPPQLERAGEGAVAAEAGPPVVREDAHDSNEPGTARRRVAGCGRLPFRNWEQGRGMEYMGSRMSGTGPLLTGDGAVPTPGARQHCDVVSRHAEGPRPASLGTERRGR